MLLRYIYFSVILFVGTASVWAAQRIKIVEVGHASSQSVVKSVKLIGVLKAHKASHLFAEVDGQVEQIYVRDGISVHRNTLLLTLVNDDLTRQQDLAKSATQLAEANYKRLTQLHHKGGASSQMKDEAQSAWLKSRLTLHEIQYKLLKTQVKAPFNGVLGTFKVSDGAMIKHGEEIVMIHDTSSYKVEFSIPTSLIDKIKIGQLVQVERNTGRIESVQRTLDPKTHMGIARAKLNRCHQCLLGTTVEVYLMVERRINVLAVPKNAVFQKRREHYVYVVRDDKAFMEKVSLGLVGNNFIEIVDGLKQGDVVVVANQSRLYHSIPVKIKP